MDDAGVKASTLAVDMPRSASSPSDRHTDIHIRMSCPSAVAVVGDVSITHPFLGKGSRSAAPWGHHLPGRVCQCAGAKNRLYSVMHAEQNLLFVPLVGTTFGSQGADAVILLFILAHRAT